MMVVLQCLLLGGLLVVPCFTCSFQSGILGHLNVGFDLEGTAPGMMHASGLVCSIDHHHHTPKRHGKQLDNVTPDKLTVRP